MALYRAIILAAGRGARLGTLTDNLPKCLLQIGSKTILENQLECLEKNGVKETTIVVGYLKDKIISRIGSQFGRMKVHYVENDIFDKTNNIYSLWLAKDYLKEGYLLLEGDLFFEELVLKRLIASPQENLAVLDTYDKTMEGTVVTLSPDKNINAMILKEEQTSGLDYQHKFKTVDIYKFSPELAQTVSSYLDTRISDGQLNEFYELVLRDIITEAKIALYGLLITDLKWFEIDTPEDLEITKRFFGQPNRSEKRA